MESKILHEKITDKIIKAFYKTYNKLGYGFIEKVCVKALVIEMEGLGLDCEINTPLKVFYEGDLVGEFFTDVIANNLVIVEVKSVEFLLPVHEIQLVNYLRCSNIEVGLLLNFGKTPRFKRKFFSNSKKIPIQT